MLTLFSPNFLAAACGSTVTAGDTQPALLAHRVVGTISVLIIHCFRHQVTPSLGVKNKYIDANDQSTVSNLISPSVFTTFFSTDN